MDNLFLKRVLFEWLRERLKEQAYAKISSLKKMGGLNSEPIDFSKIDFCSFFTSPCHEFTRF
jgi:hypothetical protein